MKCVRRTTTTSAEKEAVGRMGGGWGGQSFSCQMTPIYGSVRLYLSLCFCVTPCLSSVGSQHCGNTRGGGAAHQCTKHVKKSAIWAGNDLLEEQRQQLAINDDDDDSLANRSNTIEQQVASFFYKRNMSQSPARRPKQHMWRKESAQFPTPVSKNTKRKQRELGRQTDRQTD